MASGIDRYSLIDKVVRISNSTVDVERRVKNILELFRRDMDIDRVYLFNLNRETGTLIPRAADEEAVLPEFTIDLDDNFIGLSALKREHMIVGRRDITDLPDACLELFSEYQTLAAFPVMDDKTIYGVLVLLNHNPTDYARERLDLIETISLEMAGTIRNSRLYAESKKRITELSVLYEVGRAVISTIELDRVLDTVVTITCKVLLAQGSALNVLDTNTGILRISSQYGHIPEGCGFKYLLENPEIPPPPEVLHCVSRAAPYVGPASSDSACPCIKKDNNDHSIICLPLRFKGTFKGNLCVYNKMAAQPGRPREFNRADLDLLSTMGAMISSSLENALIFQEVDELARRNELLFKNLRSLYEISSALMTTVKKDALLDIITTALTLEQGLGFDRALIMLMSEEEDCLTGEAIREIFQEERANGIDLPLEKLLLVRKDENASATTLESEFLKTSLWVKESRGILVRTALNKKGYNVSRTDGEHIDEHDLPPIFGRLAFATVPMLAKGKVVGVIAVDRDYSGKPITDEDMRNLSMLANQAGLAIENSNLYEYIEHANTQLSRTRERLIEAEKLAALGEMAAGMAHEIRNPLVSIGGFTRRLLKNMQEDSPHKVYVQVIINEVTRLEKTLSEVLDFSSDSMGHLEEANLNEVITDALHVLRRDFKEGSIEVMKEFSDIPTVLIDERQIKHVFFNLFFNACQAMENGGGLLVKTYRTQLDDRAFVACEVEDTGPGISPEILPNIFNPFFTTKDTGTGLGLSIVHKIISRHHGEIDVVNKEDGGAAFVINLPVAEEAGLYLK